MFRWYGVSDTSLERTIDEKKQDFLFNCLCADHRAGDCIQLCDRAGTKNTYDLSYWGTQTINEDIQMTAFYYAQELDPEYQPVTFSEEIDPQAKEQIENELASIMTQSRNSLTSDANFSFRAVYKRKRG